MRATGWHSKQSKRRKSQRAKESEGESTRGRNGNPQKGEKARQGSKHSTYWTLAPKVHDSESYCY